MRPIAQISKGLHAIHRLISSRAVAIESRFRNTRQANSTQRTQCPSFIALLSPRAVSRAQRRLDLAAHAVNASACAPAPHCEEGAASGSASSALRRRRRRERKRLRASSALRRRRREWERQLRTAKKAPRMGAPPPAPIRGEDARSVSAALRRTLAPRRPRTAEKARWEFHAFGVSGARAETRRRYSLESRNVTEFHPAGSRSDGATQA